MNSIERTISVVTTWIIGIGAYAVKILINNVISILNYFKTSEICPPIKNDVLYMPATVLAKKIRKREISSKEVISIYVERIIEINKIINAVFENRFNVALEEADKVDQLIASKSHTEEELEEKFPLLGLPVTVKASIAVKGMIFSGGRNFDDLKMHRAQEDADVVRQVKDAGGIILAIGNCPELCNNVECYNKIIGTTRNPYDTRRTTGGSSGGEAGLLGCGASLLALGSDLAGSCRMPAAFCGVFGHKPTARSVSLEGHYPDSGDRERWTSHFLLGPMVRFAEDLPLLMNVICKPEVNECLKLSKKVNVQKLKIFYRYNNNGDLLTGTVDTKICKAIENVIKHFKDEGCYTKEVNLKHLNHSTMITALKLLRIKNIDNVMDDKPLRSVYFEIIKCLFGRSNHTLFSLIYVAGTELFEIFMPAKVLRTIDKLAARLTASISDTLGEDGVLIYPVSTGTAFYHGQGMGKFLDVSYTGVFNALGFPAVSCPVGFTQDGLPISIQVIGNFNCDYLTFAVAREIERAFGGWKPPSFNSI